MKQVGVLQFNPIRPRDGGGGRGGEGDSVHADFNFRELPCYLSNTYDTLLISLKFIGEQDSVNIFCQVYHLLPWQSDFGRHV